MSVVVNVEKVDVGLDYMRDHMRVCVVFTCPMSDKYDLRQTMMAAQQRGSMLIDAGAVMPSGLDRPVAKTKMNDAVGSW